MSSLLDPTLTLLDFMPDSIAADPEIIRMCEALDPDLRDMMTATAEANILPRIAEQPEAVLNAIAWELRFGTLGIWRAASLAQKRTLLEKFMKLCRSMGTPYAVERALELVPSDGQFVVEWFDEAETAHTYRIVLLVGDDGIDLSGEQSTAELARRFGRKSQKLRSVDVQRTDLAVVTDAGLAIIGLYPTYGPIVITDVAVGDGNGLPITPDPSMTALVNERARVSTNSVALIANDFIRVEGLIPITTGGFTIREVGLYVDDPITMLPVLFAVASCPPIYKPTLAADKIRVVARCRVIFQSDPTEAIALT